MPFPVIQILHMDLGEVIEMHIGDGVSDRHIYTGHGTRFSQQRSFGVKDRGSGHPGRWLVHLGCLGWREVSSTLRYTYLPFNSLPGGN